MAAACGPKVRNAGPHPWLIDLAAPPQVIPHVLAELQKSVFKGETVRTVMERLPITDKTEAGSAANSVARKAVN